tara:strand:+ start:556 stop:1020 length:465 start_codon:yes stop_codon:yes gene_type:complete
MEKKFYYYNNGKIESAESQNKLHLPAFKTIDEAKQWGVTYELEECHTHTHEGEDFYMSGANHNILKYVVSQGPSAMLSVSQKAVIELGSTFLQTTEEKIKEYNTTNTPKKPTVVKPVQEIIIRPNITTPSVSPSTGGGSVSPSTGSGGGGGGGY